MVQECARRRIVQLGLLESAITLRSHAITFFTELEFESSPVTFTDPPTELERMHHSSRDFLLHRSWVAMQLHSLRELPQLGDKQADRSVEVLLGKFERESSRLDRIVLSAWRKEMVLAGLVYLDGVPIPEPVQCSSCKHLNTHDRAPSPNRLLSQHKSSILTHRTFPTLSSRLSFWYQFYTPSPLWRARRYSSSSPPSKWFSLEHLLGK